MICFMLALHISTNCLGCTYQGSLQARVSQDQEHFLINPFGLLYGEITAGSLAKIDMQGNVIDRGNTMLGVNKAGFMLHSAIHAARPDVKCIVHTHISSTVAVS